MTMSKMFLALPLMTGLVAAGVPALAHAQDGAPAAAKQSNAAGETGMSDMMRGPMHDMMHGPHDGPHHGPMYCGPGSPFMHLDGVTLSADQKKKLRAIMEANRPADPRAAMEQTYDLRKQIRTLLTTPGPVDKARLQELEQQLASLENQRVLKHLQIDVEIHDLLTPEQLKELAARPDMPPPPPPLPGKDAPKLK
jgi:Spy/CpxP family protein refolding chaperone